MMHSQISNTQVMVIILSLEIMLKKSQKAYPYY